MMKRISLITFIVFIAIFMAYGQESEKPEFVPSGKVSAKIFMNYHMDISSESDQRNTFEILRAYFGYKYNLSEKFSTTILLDGSRSSQASAYTVFLKNAYLDWKASDQVKISMGLFALKQFNTQEKIWGYRYIFKSFQDEYGFGSSADLGINAELKVNDMVTANLFVLNGEGYTKLQDNNGRIKAGGNLIIEPLDGIVLKAYYDIYGGKADAASGEARDTASIHTLSFFGGYKNDVFRVGGEFDLQLNGTKYYQQAADHDMLGLTAFAAYTIDKKWEVMGQWMYYESSTLEGATESWNYNTDGNVILGSIQYAPVKGLKTSLNYRTFIFKNPDKDNQSYIYLNMEISF